MLDAAAEEHPGDAELAAGFDSLARRLALEGCPVDGALPGHGEIAARCPLPEADRLEHVLSEELEERIDRALGYPTHDPHGDPIPTRDLEMIERPAATLDSLEVGQCGRFTRISDHDPEMLRYLAERGIAPGADFEVVDKQPFGGPLFVRFAHGDVHVVGGLLASAMRVEEGSV